MEAIQAFIQKHLSSFIPTAIFIAVTIIATFFLAKVVNAFFERFSKKLKEKNSPYEIYVSFGKYISVFAVYFIGAMVIISNIPSLDSAVKSLLAGSGIAAVVIGFASQEAMGNLAGGLMVIVFKPFELGDFIRFVGQDIVGTVEDITLRHTTVRTVENKRIMIPNGMINQEVIENANYGEDKTCTFVDVGITYEANIDKALEVLGKTCLAYPDVLDNRSDEDKEKGSPIIITRVIALADSSVNIRAYVWAKDNATAFVMKCDLLKAVKEAFDENGIDIAYPHLTIVQK